MSSTVKKCLNGVYAAAATLVVYIVTIGSCVSLMFLLISMEEGGTALTDQALPITQAIVLLSQGSGFTAGALTLTIMPLGLTIVLVSLAITCIRKFGMSWTAMLSGGLLWLLVTFLLQQVSGIVLVDTTTVIELKALTVYLFSYAIAAFAGNQWKMTKLYAGYLKLPFSLRRTVKIAISMAAILLALFTIVAFGTVISWVILYHDAVGRISILAQMGTNSRVLSSLAALVWLPNLTIWALSWLAGGGFYVGDLASFTLWSGQSHDLPLLPIFGLFPEAVTNPVMRMLLLLTPVCICAVVSLFTLLHSKGYGLISTMKHDGLQTIQGNLIKSFASAFLGLVISAAAVLISLNIAFICSDGSLGQYRLKNVGVDLTESITTYSRATVVGCLSPWIVVVVGAATILCWNAIRTGISHTTEVLSLVSDTDAHNQSDRS